jgi:hypothetical protein
MSRFFLAVATILSLGAGTAMATPAVLKQKMQIASTQIDTRGSDGIRDSRQLASGGREYLGTTTGAGATQPSVWHQEPESISGGTEP